MRRGLDLLRSLLRRPGLTLAAVALLGLGIGAATAVLSVVDTVLLRPLPYEDPERLVRLQKGEVGSTTLPDYKDWVAHLEAFEALAAVSDETVDLLGLGEPSSLSAARVTPSFFRILGVAPERGRLLSDDDVGRAVVVVGPAMVQRHFGGDPDQALGATFRLEGERGGETVEVVGVLAESFSPPESLHVSDARVWRPLDLDDPALQHRRMYAASAIARLGAGVSLDAARSELDALAERLADAYPEGNRSKEDGRPVAIIAEPLRDAIVGDSGPTLQLLLASVGLMLLIACANVANLLLARGVERRRELAIRSAMGASKQRLAFQLLGETSVLVTAASAVGLGLAHLGLVALQRLSPGNIPRLAEVSLDVRVLGWTVALAVLTTLGVGVLPVLQGSRVDLRRGLAAGGRGAAGDRDRGRIRSCLVAGSVAATTVLLLGAAVLFHSFLEMNRVEPGFVPEGVTVASMVLGPAHLGSSDVPGLIDPEAAVGGDDLVRRRGAAAGELLEACRGLGGVESAGAGFTAPVANPYWLDRAVRFPDDPRAVTADIHPVTPGFLPTLRARFLAGRDLDDRNATANRQEVVVNRLLAQRLWPDGEALGQSFSFASLPADLTVVGVIDDLHYRGRRRDVRPQVYVPHGANAWAGELRVVVRTTPGIEIGAELRSTVRDLYPTLPIQVETLVARGDDTLTEPRFYAAFLIAFASVATLLAVGGVAASLLFTVGQRRRELGIRSALGASSGRLRLDVVGDGTRNAGAGVAMGLLVALPLAGRLEAFTFGISPRDPLTWAAAALLLIATASLVSLIPAHRASSVDPMEVLRAE